MIGYIVTLPDGKKILRVKPTPMTLAQFKRNLIIMYGAGTKVKKA
jgi:hypothetical protein